MHPGRSSAKHRRAGKVRQSDARHTRKGQRGGVGVGEGGGGNGVGRGVLADGVTHGVAHVVLHLRDRGGSGESGVLASGLIHVGLHRDGNLVLGLGVAKLVDGTGVRRDLLHREGVGLGASRVRIVDLGEVLFGERDTAKGCHDVVDLGGARYGSDGNSRRIKLRCAILICPRSLDAELERHIVFAVLRPIHVTNRLDHRDLHGRGGERIGDVRVAALVESRLFVLGPLNGAVLIGHRELVTRVVQVVAKRSLGLNKRIRARQQALERELARRGVGVCPRGIARSRLVAHLVDHGPGLVGRTIGVLFLGELPLRTRQFVFCVVLRHLGPRHRTGDLGVRDGTRSVGRVERMPRSVRIHVTLNIVDRLTSIFHGGVVNLVRNLVTLRRRHLFDVIRECRVRIRDLRTRIGLLIQIVELKLAMNRSVIICATVRHRHDSVIARDSILDRTIDSPRGTRKRRLAVRSVNLAPRNGRAVRCIRPGPREVVTLLIHIDDGSRVTLTKCCGNLRAVH